MSVAPHGARSQGSSLAIPRLTTLSTKNHTNHHGFIASVNFRKFLPGHFASPMAGTETRLAALGDNIPQEAFPLIHAAFGPVLHEQGVFFRLWAPLQNTILLAIDNGPEVEMSRADGGWHIFNSQTAGLGSRYHFVLENGIAVPDPASRHQPDGVHGPSMVVDTDNYLWRTADWLGRPWEETVLYELHIGAFTEQGTFRAAAEKLDHLARLGVTAIEIMPIHDFPGQRGWGYDGVLPYAPHAAYGRPDDLKLLVDAAHQRGISVFLDVVYNHFGPDGNYLPLYAPLFNEHHHTPWGAAINFDRGDAKLIREFIVQNALSWILDYRIDGLRLDAVHAIKDSGDEHILKELAKRVRLAAPDRHVHLMVENEHNDPELLARDDHGAPLYFTAQWNDDIHHGLHVAATGETDAYYADYEDSTLDLGRSLAEGFAFQGQFMSYRGARRGASSAHLPPTAFVSFIQNHDQIGNRALGDRMGFYTDHDALRAIVAIYLLAPQIPMLFMGEEWGSDRPFPYFCDFGEELNSQVREGRKKELAALPGFRPDLVDQAPDAAAQSTFLSAKLDWESSETDLAGDWMELYTGLLEIRRLAIMPLLRHAGPHAGSFTVEGAKLDVSWILGTTRLRLSVNLSCHALGAQQDIAGDIVWRSHLDTDGVRAPWSVLWTTEAV